MLSKQGSSAAGGAGAPAVGWAGGLGLRGLQKTQHVVSILQNSTRWAPFSPSGADLYLLYSWLHLSNFCTVQCARELPEAKRRLAFKCCLLDPDIFSAWVETWPF